MSGNEQGKITRLANGQMTVKVGHDTLYTDDIKTVWCSRRLRPRIGMRVNLYRDHGRTVAANPILGVWKVNTRMLKCMTCDAVTPHTHDDAGYHCTIKHKDARKR